MRQFGDATHIPGLGVAMLWMINYF
jgi:hypothetical protein